MAIFTGVGRLGRDAELRTTQSGDKVATLALAFSYGRKGQDGKRPTQWIDAALWGKQAESLSQYLTKGSAVEVVISDLHIETFPKQDGSQGVKLSGRIANIEFAPTNQAQQQQQRAPAPATQSTGRNSYADARNGGYSPQPTAPDFDDSDIPF